MNDCVSNPFSIEQPASILENGDLEVKAGIVKKQRPASKFSAIENGYDKVEKALVRTMKKE